MLLEWAHELLSKKRSGWVEWIPLRLLYDYKSTYGASERAKYVFFVSSSFGFWSPCAFTFDSRLLSQSFHVFSLLIVCLSSFLWSLRLHPLYLWISIFLNLSVSPPQKIAEQKLQLSTGNIRDHVVDGIRKRHQILFCNRGHIRASERYLGNLSKTF